MNVLKPEKKLALSTGEVTVRELRAVEALELFRRAAAYAGKLTNEKGELQITVDRIVDLVSGTEELARYVATTTTGGDNAWFDGLTVSDLVAVLDDAVELNLSEGTLKNVARLGDRLKTIFGRNSELKKPSPAPSTSS